MGFRPSKHRATAAEINRVAIISPYELVDSDPDQLTLLKRLVNDFDELEVSDNAAWVIKVAAVTSDNYRKIFQGGTFDRLRFRYLAYGWDDATLVEVFDDLTDAFAAV